MKPAVTSIKKLVAIQRVDVAHDLAGFVKLFGVEHVAAHNKTHRTANVGGITAYTAVSPCGGFRRYTRFRFARRIGNDMAVLYFYL